MAPPKHVLRGLLRCLRTPQLSKELVKKAAASGEKTPRFSATASYVLERYRSAATETDSETIQRQNKAATDSLRLLRNLQERQALYELDAGAEVQLTPTEMTRRAAARAGLLPPELPTDL